MGYGKIAWGRGVAASSSVLLYLCTRVRYIGKGGLGDFTISLYCSNPNAKRLCRHYRWLLDLRL